jgi:AcrR family transcriptional regulator
MTDKERNTEQLILDAAKIVFVKKGFAAASMQEIANEAGINKALLHYYFRSKEKLFQAAFTSIFAKFIPKAMSIFGSDKPLSEKIEFFVAEYMDLLLENPLIPIFILQEINRNPDTLAELLHSTGINPGFVLNMIGQTLHEEKYINIDPKHFFINLLGLCIFPVASKPLMVRIIFNNDENAYQEFLQERKTEVANFINHAILKR